MDNNTIEMVKARAKLSELGFDKTTEEVATKIHESLQHYQETLPHEQLTKLWKAIASRVKKKLFSVSRNF